jgi:hypothetical protein
MPLSTSADREPLHTRSITCRGYRRADGLWDIEGHLRDVKDYSFQTMFSERMRRRREEAAKKGDEMTASEFEEAAPRLLNSCHAFSEAGPVVKERWPAFYKDDGHAAD